MPTKRVLKSTSLTAALTAIEAERSATATVRTDTATVRDETVLVRDATDQVRLSTITAREGADEAAEGADTAAAAALAAITVVTYEIAGVAHTLGLAGIDRVGKTTNGAPVAITLPPNSEVAIPAGRAFELYQEGAGQVSIVAGVGVTIKPATGTKLRAQGSFATLLYEGADTWLIAGDLTT